MNFINEYKNTINSFILNYLDDIHQKNIQNSEMIDMMKYCLLNESKKIRSIMAMIFGEIFGIKKFIDIKNYILAIEITHTYTLIHDDLPSLDNDDFRRGKPSAHKKFGEANAILLGDALQTLAFECISDENNEFPAKQILKVVNYFAQSIGGLNGIIYGEYLDINEYSSNLEQIKKIHLYKTAKLFEFCTTFCGVLMNCDEKILEKLKKLGIYYGLAFQLLDDRDDSAKKTHEINICHILNQNETNILYENYMSEIFSAINFFKEKKYANIEKLEQFIMKTLKKNTI